MIDRLLLAALTTSPVLAGAARAAPQGRDFTALVRDRVEVRYSGATERASFAGSHGSAPLAAGAGDVCELLPVAFHGQPVPGGGTLEPLAFANPATIDGAGRLAFVSKVGGAARNQGVFLADEVGLTPVVLGCGGGGGSGVPGAGCGDAAPGGGTFSGFFTGTVFVPATNAAGDLLFVADVDGGPSPRGLFLRRAASGVIEKVAAVGDASPLGSTFAAVSPGSLNSQGEVVFGAREASSGSVNVFRWSAGALSVVAAVGDPAPGGGSYQLLVTESLGYSDGTSIPIGPLPDVNDAGDVSFRAIVSGGPTSRGIVVSRGGVHDWYVRAGDATPAGGTYFDFQGAILNELGEIAFFADFKPTPTTFKAGWFVGAPGSWRKALAFADKIDSNGECTGLAFSRNPMSPLDDEGELVLWARVSFPNGTVEERLLLSHTDGTLTTVATEGDLLAGGGALGGLQAWPSMEPLGRGTLGASTPGAPGMLNAHLRFARCAPHVLGVSPGGGDVAGGTALAVHGLNFDKPGVAGSLTVQIGDGPPIAATAVSDTELQVAAPAGTPGPVDLGVTTPYGTASLADAFGYWPAVLVSSPVAIGATAELANWGPPGGVYEAWASTVTTSLPLPPFGTLLIGPIPLLKIVAGAYPADATPAVKALAVPADAQLAGLDLHFQSVAVSSGPTIALSNRATMSVE